MEQWVYQESKEMQWQKAFIPPGDYENFVWQDLETMLLLRPASISKTWRLDEPLMREVAIATKLNQQYFSIIELILTLILIPIMTLVPIMIPIFLIIIPMLIPN